MKTFFASPERAGSQELARVITGLNDCDVVPVLLESVSGFLVILNKSRQLLLANQQFLDLLNVSTLEPLMGQRLGEIFQCRNVPSAPSGCGTAEACQFCGAVLSMVKSLETGESSEQECHMCVQAGEHFEVRELKVRCTPLDIGADRVLVFVFYDISAAKRREVLEQVFLHDLRNLIGGIVGWTQSLGQSCTDDEARQSLYRLSELVVHEVQAQGLLQEAENGSLQVQFRDVSVGALFGSLRDLFTGERLLKNRKLDVPSADFPGVIRGDFFLVSRVLVNMVKNALEASAPGQTVTVRFQEDDRYWRFQVHNPAVMDFQSQKRVFERSFSTKGQTGRGLGTYAMKLFGENCLGGRVYFDSLDGAGTTFHFDLPKRRPERS